MTNLPFVFSKYIYSLSIFWLALFKVNSHDKGKEIDNSERLLKCLLWVTLSNRTVGYCFYVVLPCSTLSWITWHEVTQSAATYPEWDTDYPPPPSLPLPRFCRVSLTVYRYPFKLLDEERLALWKLSAFPKDASRCKLLDPESSPLIGPMQCVFRSAVRNRLFSTNNLII